MQRLAIEEWGAVGGMRLHRLLEFVAGRRGAVSPLLALMLVPLVGALGMAVETSNWYLTQRAAQNAADAAVMAAASNNSGTSTNAPTYSQEAAAVATKYNFTNGTNNTTVSASIPATCPAGMPTGATTCYQVTITRKIPLSMTQVTGYTGNTTIGSANAVLINATAIASAPLPVSVCMLTLATSPGKNNGGFSLKGGPSFTASGCSLYSNGTADCAGHNGGFGVTFAVGTDNGCGTSQVTPVPKAADPFAQQFANYPPSCTTLSVTTLPSTLTINGCTKIANNVSLTGATTITTGGSGILEMDAGSSIDLNGNALSAAVGQGLTIVFTGTSGAPGFIIDSSPGSKGSVSFSAPSSGNWSGIAIYQNPALTTISNQNYTGGSPNFAITGLIYAPYTNLTFSGSINHQLNGLDCIAFIANTLATNGTGSIVSNPTSQCYQAGLTGLPTVPGSVQVRQALVQ